MSRLPAVFGRLLQNSLAHHLLLLLLLLVVLLQHISPLPVVFDSASPGSAASVSHLSRPFNRSHRPPADVGAVAEPSSSSPPPPAAAVDARYLQEARTRSAVSGTTTASSMYSGWNPRGMTLLSAWQLAAAACVYISMCMCACVYTYICMGVGSRCRMMGQLLITPYHARRHASANFASFLSGCERAGWEVGVVQMKTGRSRLRVGALSTDREEGAVRAVMDCFTGRSG
ncbi:hypothetical protein Vretifemale_13259 [Volvox reticuliferus]|uniref:Uncharacterized protein n=1 Tax=Volvox reticuliferus TaxID=1737510 RepID=A0A8J4CME8_9CHLO|nr:hypothetical protein Vretifemale_13259 [Volvox reticuliferus]